VVARTPGTGKWLGAQLSGGVERGQRNIALLNIFKLAEALGGAFSTAGGAGGWTGANRNIVALRYRNVTMVTAYRSRQLSQPSAFKNK
jgi:hypothetical protein